MTTECAHWAPNNAMETDAPATGVASSRRRRVRRGIDGQPGRAAHRQSLGGPSTGGLLIRASERGVQ